MINFTLTDIHYLLEVNYFIMSKEKGTQNSKATNNVAINSNKASTMLIIVNEVNNLVNANNNIEYAS